MSAGKKNNLVQSVRAVELCGLPVGLRALRRFEFRHKLGILERLYGAELEPLGVRWVEAANGVAWKLDLSNPTHRWIVYGKYEGPGFLNWAQRHLPRDGVVVDSGANVGQMLIYLASFVPQGRLLAFEPDVGAMAWLRECLAANPQLPVRCFDCGLGASEANMFLQTLGPAQLHGAQNQVSATQGTPIRIRRLQDVLHECGVETVHLWKLDVEGYELAALAGAEPLLRSHAIRAIYAELAFGRGREIVAHLQERGYRSGRLDRHGHVLPMGELPEHANGLFLSDGGAHER